MKMKWNAIILPTALIERQLYSHNDDQTGIQIKFTLIFFTELNTQSLLCEML